MRYECCVTPAGIRATAIVAYRIYVTGHFLRTVTLDLAVHVI